MPEPISFDTLTDLVLCDDGISYFDYAECLAELVKTEHIICYKSKYSLTAKGVRNGEITENNIAYSVRLKADKKAAKVRSELTRDAMIKTTHKHNEDGSCTVNLALSDGIGEIISINMFTANEQQANEIEKGFRNKAEDIYNGIIKLILDAK